MPRHFTYSNRVIRLDHGPDGAPGGGDDLRLEEGVGPVDEIMVVTKGVAMATHDDSGDTALEQAALDDLAAWLRDRVPVLVPTAVEHGGVLERTWLSVEAY